MNLRILSAAVLAPLAIAAVLWLPTAALLALVAALLLAGLWEWTRLCGLEHAPARVAVLAAHAVLFAWLAWRGWPGLYPWIALAGVIWWLLAALWLRHFSFGSGPRARPLKLAIGSLLVVPAWCALALLHAAPEFGPRWALLAIALVWFADSGAYFSGRQFGGAKLAPTISPAKTWAGFWGGLAASALLALAAAPLLGVGLAQLPALLVLVLLAAAASVVGDLFESLAKRHSGHKDSGAVIPGHGGVLDRIDSLVAALPVFAIAKDWLGL